MYESKYFSLAGWQYVDAAADATHDSYISLESKRKVLAKTVRCKTMIQSERERKKQLYNVIFVFFSLHSEHRQVDNKTLPQVRERVRRRFEERRKTKKKPGPSRVSTYNLLYRRIVFAFIRNGRVKGELHAPCHAYTK